MSRHWRGNALNADGKAGVSAHNDGTQGKQVGTDGRDHKRIDIRREDWTVGGECVGRGAGGCGDDDTVGAEAGNFLAVELNGKFAHARNVAFGDDDFIQGFEYFERSYAVADDSDATWCARRAYGSFAPAFEGLIEVTQADFSKEPKRAEIDAEDGRTGGGEDAATESKFHRRQAR